MREPVFPTNCEVVIIGGGVIGCSIAYHLTKLGISDVVLLERRQLTSGTTWHAAGLVGQLRGSQNLTRLAKYTAELYHSLEQETGQATGFKQNGSISIATTEGRLEELRRMCSMAQVFDLPVTELAIEDIKARYPLLNVSDVKGAISIPSDGQINPVDVTQALAKGARNGGARVLEDTIVTSLELAGGRISGVRTNRGMIKAPIVVIAAGMWSRDFAQQVGVHVPLHACEHFYIVTEPIPELGSNLPVLRDYDAYSYYKEDAGKILLGAFEPISKPWGMDGIPASFCFDELPEDYPHFEPVLEAAMHRLPILNEVGIQTFFCGPESFTPDVRYYLGESPNLKNCFVAAGLNSIGIQSAGGIGKVLADWIKNGYAPMDLWEVDIRRGLPFQTNKKYLHDRVTESLGLLYAMHWPNRQYESARGVRKSPFHARLESAGACHGEAFGWERANWFVSDHQAPKYEYSYGKPNWFEAQAREHLAVRQGVGLFDQSSFAKFLLQGRDAANVLNYLSANNVDVQPGRVVYTQWLNERGGIEADLTITRISTTEFLIVTSGETEIRDFAWLTQHIPDDAHAFASNVTSAYAVLSVMGPESRNLLSVLSPNDFTNEAFPFGDSQEVELAYARVRANRISYVGELGWEIYIPTEFALSVYDELIQSGQKFSLQHAGYHALNSLRLEKAYRHWGHDIGIEETPVEAGLMHVVKLDKGEFIGRDAVIERASVQKTRAMVQFLLEDDNAMLFHNEPVWRNGELVGYITSGMFGHSLGAAVGLGYVQCEKGVDADYVASGDFEIEIAGQKFAAKASLQAMYDPGNERIRN
ncbi:MAG: FAD-dependent oxidoreductase [Pseudomonadota bacterium]